MSATDIFALITASDTEGAVAAVRAEPSLARARNGELGSTPLIFAAHRGQLDVVRALLAAGAPIDELEQGSGTSALHWAAEAGHESVMRALLETFRSDDKRRAEMSRRCAWFALTPLGWGVIVDWAPQFRKDRAATAALLEKSGAAADGLVLAARDDGPRLMKADDEDLALRLGFVGDDQTALHVAVDRGCASAVDALLARRADPMARTASGLTALAYAVRKKNAALADRLRKAGAYDDASVALYNGDLARLKTTSPALASRLLHAAVRADDGAAVTALLEAGADRAHAMRALRGEIAATLNAQELADAISAKSAAAALA